jgi:hypothetical protein
MNSKEEDSLEQRVIQQINYRLQYSRDRREREVLKSLLLAVGLTKLTNSKDNTYVMRQQET